MLEALILHAGLGIAIHFTAPNGEKIKPNGRYRWVQTVLVDSHGIKDAEGKRIGDKPYLDPPAGGYQYSKADTNIFYWDDADFEGGSSRHRVNHYKNYTKDGKFVLTDFPQEPRLKKDEAVIFETCAVDTYSDIPALEQKDNCIEWELTRFGVRVR